MTFGLLLSSAFMTGLLGSTHCVGMCGGIVSVLGCGQSSENNTTNTHSLGSFIAYHSAYNGGRIISYAIIGMIVAYISMQSTAITPVFSFPFGMVISGIFMVLLGFYISGWWRILGQLERVGAYFWAYLKPIGQRILPIKSVAHAFALGLVWGWLPCGLVYTALGLAALSFNPLMGAAIMLSFGLGTLPMLLAVGSGAGTLNKWVQNTNVRRFAGVLMMIMGFLSMFSAFQMRSKAHNHSTAMFLPQLKQQNRVNLSTLSQEILSEYEDNTHVLLVRHQNIIVSL